MNKNHSNLLIALVALTLCDAPVSARGVRARSKSSQTRQRAQPRKVKAAVLPPQKPWTEEAWKVVDLVDDMLNPRASIIKICKLDIKSIIQAQNDGTLRQILDLDPNVKLGTVDAFDNDDDFDDFVHRVNGEIAGVCEQFHRLFPKNQLARETKGPLLIPYQKVEEALDFCVTYPKTYSAKQEKIDLWMSKAIQGVKNRHRREDLMDKWQQFTRAIQSNDIFWPAWEVKTLKTITVEDHKAKHQAKMAELRAQWTQLRAEMEEPGAEWDKGLAALGKVTAELGAALGKVNAERRAEWDKAAAEYKAQWAQWAERRGKWAKHAAQWAEHMIKCDKAAVERKAKWVNVTAGYEAKWAQWAERRAEMEELGAKWPERRAEWDKAAAEYEAKWAQWAEQRGQWAEHAAKWPEDRIKWDKEAVERKTKLGNATAEYEAKWAKWEQLREKWAEWAAKGPECEADLAELRAALGKVNAELGSKRPERIAKRWAEYDAKFAKYQAKWAEYDAKWE